MIASVAIFAYGVIGTIIDETMPYKNAVQSERYHRLDGGGVLDLTRATFDFVQYATTAKSILDLKQRFSGLIRECGYLYYCCVEVKAPGGILVGEELIGQTHPDWHRRYFEQGYSRDDAVLADAMSREEPFYWTDIAKQRHLRDREARILDEARDFGAYEGFCTPIHNLDGSMSMVSLFGEENVDRSADAATTLHLASLAFGGAARRLSCVERIAAAPARRLTARQAEIVQLVATGHRLDEIGDRLSISENTVRNHLNAAKERYNVRTLAQLAVEATRHREFIL